MQKSYHVLKKNVVVADPLLHSGTEKPSQVSRCAIILFACTAGFLHHTDLAKSTVVVLYPGAR